jgi:hypothetical protein
VFVAGLPDSIKRKSGQSRERGVKLIKGLLFGGFPSTDGYWGRRISDGQPTAVRRLNEYWV